MPLYIPYLVFEQDNGRPPRADELTFDQRAELLDCLLADLRAAGRKQILREAFARYADDPKALNEILNVADPAFASSVRKVLFTKGYRPLMKDLLADLGEPVAAESIEYFVDLMRAVGIPSRPRP